ncbi:DUF397 domain-containing protein [Streptomyces sp. NPDC053048]|uniref:DUF397 domain-containing protein n=1 Tax=Streptomyces sp. NPDC053048 TaxID=3365694 RepID=UPI0037D245DF
MSSACVVWRKSTYSSNNGGDCLEWAPSVAASGVVPVRDSKRPTGPTLTLSAGSWSAFVTSMKDEAASRL